MTWPECIFGCVVLLVLACAASMMITGRYPWEKER